VPRARVSSMVAALWLEPSLGYAAPSVLAMGGAAVPLAIAEGETNRPGNTSRAAIHRQPPQIGSDFTSPPVSSENFAASYHDSPSSPMWKILGNVSPTSWAS
jgi:hypothetical protein